MTGMRTVSADSHVVEPPNLWPDYIEPAFRERAPHIAHQPDGDVYVCEGVNLLPIALFAAFGKPTVGLHTKVRFEEYIPPGAYQPHARVADMATDGLEAEVLYPTVALRMFALPDGSFRRAIFRAYNRWLADFCGAAPDQLKGIGMVDTEDISDAVAELERLRKIGLAGAMISVDPDGDTYFRPEFDRFWAKATELDLPVSLHVNTQRADADLRSRLSKQLHFYVQSTLHELIASGVLMRHPSLRIVSAENGAGWAPFLLMNMDFSFERFRRAGYWPGLADSELRPSDYFRRQVTLTFMEDAVALRNRDLIGVDRLAWASDYPHREGTFPHSREVLAEMLKDVPPEECAPILAGNAARLYGI
jgi:predicted TIM-barrel fold metal-dependent hydrolase